MALYVPNEASATYLPQSGLDSSDIDNIIYAVTGAGMVSGCAVTAVDGTMTVNVAAGVAQGVGGVLNVAASSGLAITAAAATDRKDCIYIDGSSGSSSYSVIYLAGTASTSTVNGVTSAGSRDPSKPAISNFAILLAEIYVPAGVTAITSAMIIDKRIFPVSFNPNMRSITGNLNFSLRMIDEIHFVTPTAAVSWTFPASTVATKGKRFTVHNTGTTFSAAKLTLLPGSGNTFEGNSSQVVYSGESFTYVYDGTTWRLTAYSGAPKWIAYTPTFAGATPSSYVAQARMIAPDTVQIRIAINSFTSVTTTAFSASLPSTMVSPSDGFDQWGVAKMYAGTNNYGGLSYLTSNSSTMVPYMSSGSPSIIAPVASNSTPALATSGNIYIGGTFQLAP